MSVLDHNVPGRFEEETKRHWGNTYAYAESVEKTSAYTEKIWDVVSNGLMAVFGEFVLCMKAGESAENYAAQMLVKQLQSYISAHFYTCSKEILAGLGQMYVGDERFTQNIDAYGAGTAAFVAAAIRHYCEH